MGDAKTPGQNSPARRVPKHPEPEHPAIGTGRFGPKNQANLAGRSKPDVIAARTIGAACREAHSAEELQAALWSIFAGVDPFAEGRKKKNPDKLPVADDGTIDWQHRMKAGEMWANYAHGKPLQGVVVDAQIQQSTAITHVAVGPIDPRSLSPSVRAALRTVAQAALGRVPDPTVVEVPLAAPQSAPAPNLTEPGERRASDVSLGDASLFDVDGIPLALEGAPRSGLTLGVKEGVDVSGHGQTVESDPAPVKTIVLDFPGSSNLWRAELADGILSVQFKGPTGEPGRVCRYRNVTPDMMARWRAAPSAGAWFAREIRVRHQQYPMIPDAVRAPGAVI